MTKEQTTAKKFFLDEPFYKKFKTSDHEEILNFGNKNEKLIFYCTACKSEYPHKRVTVSAGTPPGGSSTYRKKQVEEISTFKFACSNCERITYFILKFEEENFFKIGEYPSKRDRYAKEHSKYIKELGKEFTDDLRTAILLYNSDIGVGAFVYLRRVFEKVISDTASKKNETDNNWSLDDWKKKSIEEKIKELDNELPKFLVDNQNLYQLLSLGVHELSDEVCLKYFDVVRESIEHILDNKIIADLNNEREKRNKGEISSIFNELGSGKQ
jgi:hypothetical protein